MITYNHERYIRQAIESVLKQRTTFPIELVISEDCGTDNTRNICLEYKEKYPNKIKLLLPTTNLGVIPNFFQTLEACGGKYIAICEGDDYWTDPYKLQKQVDFLELNPDFNICCHRASVLNEKNKTLKTPKALKQSVFTQEDVANHNVLQTLTEVFRSSALKPFPKESFNSISGDFFINMMLSETGKIKYLPDVMAVYRQHGGGSWHSLGAVKLIQNTLSVLNYYLSTDLKENVKENLKKNMVRHYLMLYNIQKENGNDIEAKDILAKIFLPDFLAAINTELIKFTKQQKSSKEYKIGKMLLKPYVLFLGILDKIKFIIHRLKYE